MELKTLPRARRIAGSAERMPLTDRKMSISQVASCKSLPDRMKKFMLLLYSRGFMSIREHPYKTHRTVLFYKGKINRIFRDMGFTEDPILRSSVGKRDKNFWYVHLNPKLFHDVRKPKLLPGTDYALADVFTSKHRRVIKMLAGNCFIPSDEFLDVLGMEIRKFRSRTTAIYKIAKGMGIPNPVKRVRLHPVVYTIDTRFARMFGIKIYRRPLSTGLFSEDEWKFFGFLAKNPDSGKKILGKYTGERVCVNSFAKNINKKMQENENP